MTTDQNEWFRSLNAGLPDDVARLKAAGYYEEAVARIDALLAEDWTAVQNGPNTGANPAPAMPDAQREALLAQREILRRLPAEYIYTEQQAVEKMQAQVTGFTLEELRALERAGRVDWRFVEGEKHYFDRFDETLLATDPAFAARRRVPEPDSGASLARRKATHEKMLREGSASARITVEASVGMSDAAFARALARARAEGRHTVHVRAWLPLPAACESQSDLRLEHFSEPPAHVAAPDAPQRTAFWEANLAENRRFTARYSYTQTARYADPLGFASDPDQPSFDTGEEAPHIVFTPYLRALAKDICRGCSTPAEKARAIYDYVTGQVDYRYQPAYLQLDCIADQCAKTLRGDCGVFALLFITLCRISGIPARWQSGLAVRPDSVGPHDWAMFYLAPHGWLWADCSFGSSARRNGETERRRHYFGSLDPWRMVANSAFQAPLTPPMQDWRQDPYDNQVGEMMVGGRGLDASERETSQELLEFELLPGET